MNNEFGIIVGKSMYPILKEGDIIHITNCEPQLGNIVVFRYLNTIYTHRLIYKTPIITKGDNRGYFDLNLTKSDILGVVDYSLKKDTNKIVYLNNKYDLNFFIIYNKIEMKIIAILRKLTTRNIIYLITKIFLMPFLAFILLIKLISDKKV